jgi:hypothetical protein
MPCKQSEVRFRFRLFLLYETASLLYEMTFQSRAACKAGVSAMLYRNTIDPSDRC